MMARHIWTEESRQTLQRLYPDFTAEIVANVIGCSVRAVYAQANSQGLKKSADFMASDRSGRIARGKQHPSMIASQFKPGLVPWNAGLKGWKAGGRSAETRFKKGCMTGAAKHNYVPIGTLRVNKDGYLERKMNDDPNIYPARRWLAVHRLVWEAAHGPIPDGHIVVFKHGMKTSVLEDVTHDRLECITRAENARRNHPRSKSPEFAKLVQLKGAITRQVNRINREHAEKQGATA